MRQANSTFRTGRFTMWLRSFTKVNDDVGYCIACIAFAISCKHSAPVSSRSKTLNTAFPSLTFKVQDLALTVIDILPAASSS